MQVIPIKESFTLSITSALFVDFASLMRKTWLMSVEQTRHLFSRFDAKEVLVAERILRLYSSVLVCLVFA